MPRTAPATLWGIYRFPKAFDTKDRAILWKTLSKFGCPPIFLKILRDFHDDFSAQVIYGGASSEIFPVQVGVKQGCVLAPVIFNIFMTVVALYARKSFLQNNGISVKYRHDGNLFNQRRLSAQSKTSVTHSYELQYADDTALVSHTTDGLQQLLDGIVDAYSRAGLVKIKKTEILQQCTSPNHAPPVFNIKDCPIANVDEFVYLGTVLNNKLDLPPDIQRRVRLASSAFGRLSQRVFLNRNLNLKTKMAVYSAVCVSALLYGCEAWVLYRRHIKTLEQFHISCLQRMLRLHWWDKVPHVEIHHHQWRF